MLRCSHLVKSAVFTELELSNCLMTYRNCLYLKHLALKTMKKLDKNNTRYCYKRKIYPLES
jgi:hypothetical protein